MSSMYASKPLLSQVSVEQFENFDKEVRHSRSFSQMSKGSTSSLDPDDRPAPVSPFSGLSLSPSPAAALLQPDGFSAEPNTDTMPEPDRTVSTPLQSQNSKLMPRKGGVRIVPTVEGSTQQEVITKYLL